MSEALSEIADRVVRVFVSSTFRDMHAERDELVKRVFPQLRRLCDERGVSFVDVDLRWGVTDEGKRSSRLLRWPTRLTPWPERRLAASLPRRCAGFRRLSEPAPEGMKLAGRFRLFPERRRDAWADPVLLDGRLYLRYHDTLWCYDVRVK